MTITSVPRSRRPRAGEIPRLAATGIRTRKPRAALSALGITIGIAAIVAVLGLSSSSAAELHAEISALGTNLLTATSGQTLSGAAAERYLRFDGHPSEIYVRAADSAVAGIDNLLAAQANPEHPSEVDVFQPSAALVAQAEAQGAFDILFLGLGAVALLVGAIGVANIMVISVLERRSEIGLRRALGATKGQIRLQFLAEVILLSLAGGAAGIAAGAAATAIYAHAKGWAVIIPAGAWAGGLGTAVVIGAIAGLLPAIRAARVSPTQALWSI